MKPIHLGSNCDIYDNDVNNDRGCTRERILAKFPLDAYEEVSPTVEYLFPVGDIYGNQEIHTHDIHPEE